MSRRTGFPSLRTAEKENRPGEIMLEVETLTGEYSRLKEASFSLRGGEILGVAGLDGSGRTELLETVFGLRKKRSGRILLSGKEIKNRTPKESIAKGFALVTEERRQSGIFGILSILENTVISSIKSYRRFGLLSKIKMLGATKDSIQKLSI